MGTSYSVYVGAYLSCEAKEVTLTRKRKKCENKHSVGDYSKAAFCEQCGKPIAEVDEEYVGRNVNSYQVFEEIGEGLFPANTNGLTDNFMPNMRRGNSAGFTIHIREEELFAKAITPQEVALQIEDFKLDYADEIEAITKLYGNGEVKWGVIYNAN